MGGLRDQPRQKKNELYMFRWEASVRDKWDVEYHGYDWFFSFSFIDDNRLARISGVHHLSMRFWVNLMTVHHKIWKTVKPKQREKGTKHKLCRWWQYSHFLGFISPPWSVICRQQFPPVLAQFNTDFPFYYIPCTCWLAALANWK